MKKRIASTAALSLTLLFAGTTISFAQKESPPGEATTSAIEPAATESKITNAPKTESKIPATLNDAELMKQMMELSKTGENHQLLSYMAGNWNYTLKMWMNPSQPPTSSTGSAVFKATMDGRFFIGDVTGKMPLPDAKGEMKEKEFKGMSIDGYDNVKKKFVSLWLGNTGTGMTMSDGTYDSASKTFNYYGEYEAMPGMKTKVRTAISVVDKDHHTLQFFEDRGTGEAVKTMEINYTRKK